MPLAVENVCCRQNPYITVSEIFDNNVLNRDILSIAMASRSDVMASRAIYNPANYRKAAYPVTVSGLCGSMVIWDQMFDN